MRSLTDHLSQYGAYHRDRRNIATHFVGVPMIVVSVLAALARITLGAGGISFSAALVAYAATILFYLRLDRRYGIAMAGLMGAAAAVGTGIGQQPFAIWLGAVVGLFGIGWVIQFVGHAFEGKRPAFVDDLVGLLVGPLFVAAEAGFLLGLRIEVKNAIEARVGPTRSGAESRPALG